MGFYTVRTDLSVDKRVARFFFCFYNIVQIFLTVGIMSNYQEDMKNIIPFYFSILINTGKAKRESNLYQPLAASILCLSFLLIINLESVTISIIAPIPCEALAFA